MPVLLEDLNAILAGVPRGRSTVQLFNHASCKTAASCMFARIAYRFGGRNDGISPLRRLKWLHLLGTSLRNKVSVLVRYIVVEPAAVAKGSESLGLTEARTYATRERYDPRTEVRLRIEAL